jgi:PAS domain S-box-containing protein
MDSIYPEINHSLNIVFQENPQPMWLFDISSLKFLTVNRAAETHYGYSKDEFLSMTVRDIRPKDDMEKFDHTLKGLSGPATTKRPFRHLKKGGAIMHVDVISFPVPYQGRHARLVMINDITESTLLLERFDLMSRATNDAIWDWNLESNELWWNKSFLNLFRYQKEDLENDIVSWTNRIHPEDKVQVVSSIHEALNSRQENWTKSYRFLKGDGTYANVIDRGYTLFKDNKAVRMVGSMMDVTLQFQLEQAKAQSESILQTISSASPTALWMSDVEGNLVYINQKWLDWSNASLADNQIDGWLRIVHQDDLAFVSGTYQTSVLERKPYEVDYRIVLETGEERWVLSTGFPRFDADDTFTGFVGSVTDITRQKHMELQKDTFINTVSHELKTPIATIKGFGQLLRKSNIANDDRGKNYLNRMLVQAERVDKLLQDLLDVSRIESGKLTFNDEEIEVNLLISELVQDLQLIYPTHTLLLVENAKCKIYGDRSRILQLITNLVDNAVKYSPDAKEVLISLFCDEEFATVGVQDFGAGIVKGNEPFLFDKFYQVNNVYKTPGLGIGLYVCKEIINRLNGKIWFESIVGEGSTFYIKVPRQIQKPLSTD